MTNETANNLVLGFNERRVNEFVVVGDVENLRVTAEDVENADASVARRAAKKRRGMKATNDLRVLNESMKKSRSDSSQYQCSRMSLRQDIVDRVNVMVWCGVGRTVRREHRTPSQTKKQPQNNESEA